MGQSSVDGIDLYRLLQVIPEAELEIIEVAYRRLARKHHPDVSSDTDAGALMQALNRAYAILSDPVQRAAYDARQRTRASHEEPPGSRSTAADGGRAPGPSARTGGAAPPGSTAPSGAHGSSGSSRYSESSGSAESPESPGFSGFSGSSGSSGSSAAPGAATGAPDPAWAAFAAAVAAMPAARFASLAREMVEATGREIELEERLDPLRLQASALLLGTRSRAIVVVSRASPADEAELRRLVARAQVIGADRVELIELSASDDAVWDVGRVRCCRLGGGAFARLAATNGLAARLGLPLPRPPRSGDGAAGPLAATVVVPAVPVDRQDAARRALAVAVGEECAVLRTRTGLDRPFGIALPDADRAQRLVRELARAGVVGARRVAPHTGAAQHLDAAAVETLLARGVVLLRTSVPDAAGRVRCHRCGATWPAGATRTPYCPRCGSGEWGHHRLTRCGCCGDERAVPEVRGPLPAGPCRCCGVAAVGRRDAVRHG